MITLGMGLCVDGEKIQVLYTTKKMLLILKGKYKKAVL